MAQVLTANNSKQMEFHFILDDDIEVSYAEMGYIKIISNSDGSEFTSKLTYVIFDAIDMISAFNKFITNQKEKWWTYDTSAQGNFHLKIERRKNNKIAVFVNLKLFDIISIQEFYNGFRIGVNNLEADINARIITDEDPEAWGDFFEACRILKNIDIEKCLLI
jgi:hypothetical protein